MAGFILLFDHSATYLLAASGAIGLSVGYVCKDFIADFVNSIAIQTDRLIAINDWIEFSGGDKPVYYQIIQFDQRMVTLKDKYDYLVKIPNTRFMGMSYINLSKQADGRGSRRVFDIKLDALNHSEKVLEILNLAMESVTSRETDFMNWHFCGIKGWRSNLHHCLRVQSSPQAYQVHYSSHDGSLALLEYCRH